MLEFAVVPSPQMSWFTMENGPTGPRESGWLISGRFLTRALRSSIGQARAHCALELLGRKWFLKKPGSGGRVPAEQVAGGKGRDVDDRHLWAFHPQVPAKLPAIQVWHHDIGDDEV